jgi:histone acetyltransferase (RNA polymerase elongator complex component)
VTIAERYGIRMYSCCGEYLVNDRIHKAHCIDGAIIERLFAPPGFAYREKPTRQECGCTESIDIGAYDTCPHGCVYCYANADKAVACEAFRKHDPDSAFLGVDKTRSEQWLAEIRRSDSDQSTIAPTFL